MDLLLAAFPPELGEFQDHPPPGWLGACVGVGALAAAVETSRLLLRHGPRQVLFLGTCGALDPGLGVGSLVAVAEVLDTSLEERRGEAFRPELQRARWTLGLVLRPPGVVVAATPAITASTAGALALAEVAQVEHLELAGVAAACEAFGVELGALLGVANPVGPEGHGVWLREHARVSQSLREELRRLLKA